MQQRRKNNYETTTDENSYKEDRFRQYEDSNDRKDDYYTNQPLARISFGKLPYPIGSAS